jgi:ribosomal protein L37E
MAEKQRTHKMTLRSQVLARGNNRCARCGYDADVRALHIDHVNGGGASERRAGELFSRPITRQSLVEILARMDTGELQILCANCNWIKRLERREDRWAKLRAQRAAASPPASK